ncbi:hypothetical protein ScPMuIL_002189 [Solemya velum]
MISVSPIITRPGVAKWICDNKTSLLTEEDEWTPSSEVIMEESSDVIMEDEVTITGAASGSREPVVSYSKYTVKTKQIQGLQSLKANLDSIDGKSSPKMQGNEYNPSDNSFVFVCRCGEENENLEDIFSTFSLERRECHVAVHIGHITEDVQMKVEQFIPVCIIVSLQSTLPRQQTKKSVENSYRKKFEDDRLHGRSSEAMQQYQEKVNTVLKTIDKPIPHVLKTQLCRCGFVGAFGMLLGKFKVFIKYTENEDIAPKVNQILTMTKKIAEDGIKIETAKHVRIKLLSDNIKPGIGITNSENVIPVCKPIRTLGAIAKTNDGRKIGITASHGLELQDNIFNEKGSQKIGNVRWQWKPDELPRCGTLVDAAAIELNTETCISLGFLDENRIRMRGKMYCGDLAKLEQKKVFKIGAKTGVTHGTFAGKLEMEIEGDRYTGYRTIYMVESEMKRTNLPNLATADL